MSKLHFYKYFGAFSVIFNLGTGSSVHFPPAAKYGIYDSFVIIMSMKLKAYHNVCTEKPPTPLYTGNQDRGSWSSSSSMEYLGNNWVDTHMSSALLLIKYGVLLCCGQCWCWAEAGPDAAISIRELWLYLIFLNYLYLASYQPPVSSIFTQGPAGFSLLIPTTLHFIWRHFRQLLLCFQTTI